MKRIQHFEFKAGPVVVRASGLTAVIAAAAVTALIVYGGLH